MTRLRHLLWLCLLFVTAGFPTLLGQTKPDRAQGQQSPPLSIPVFKSTVRRVVVDVVVRDAKGNPVHGLSSKDFSVFEDNKPQHILSLESYDFDRPSLSLPADAPALPRNTFVNVPTAPERGPLYVVLYDMVNMEIEDQITARQQILKFIAGKPEGTRFAVWVNSDGLHLVQGFTSDKALLSAVLDPQHSAPHVPRSFLLARNYGQGDTLSSMSVLTYIASFLNGLPGRKNLLWMAGRFPVKLYPTPGDPQDLHDDIKRELDELARAQVAVYPVNIRGVVMNPEGALTGTSPYGGSRSVEPLPGGGSGSSSPGGSTGSGTIPGGTLDRSSAALQSANNVQLSGASNSLTDNYMIQNDVAIATGGRAFYSDNDLKAALDEATENGSNYYTLTYSPSNSIYNGSLRNIRIALSRPNCRLQYRRSYYADDPYTPTARQRQKLDSEDDAPEEFAVNAHERPLYAGLQHGAPLVHELIFKVRVHPIGESLPATDEQLAKLATQPAFLRGKNKKPKLPKSLRVQKYAIHYVIASAQIKRAQAGPLPLEFAAVGFDSEGIPLNGVFEVASDETSSDPAPQAVDATPTRARKQPAVYRAIQELFLPVNATSIRAAVRDLANDRVGAVEIPLPLAEEAPEAALSQGDKTN